MDNRIEKTIPLETNYLTEPLLKSQGQVPDLFIPKINPFAQEQEKKFQAAFPMLEDYLIQVLEEHNFRFSKGSEEEEKISMSKAKAREYFKNSAGEIFRNAKKKFEEQQFHHIMPDNYFQDSLARFKTNISASLDQLTDRIHQSASVENSPLRQSDLILKKKIRKGKTKISKKALTILKNWLTENFQDPYPSHTEKVRLAGETGITLKQVQNWFTNARGRIWRRTCNQEKFSLQIEEKLLNDTQK